MEQKKILSRCPLFSGLTEAEMGAVLREMQVKEKDYEKGEILLFAGEVPRDFGIVLEGRNRNFERRIQRQHDSSVTGVSRRDLRRGVCGIRGALSGDGGGGKEDENPVDFLRTDDAARKEAEGERGDL
ncbi:MAG: hypothetical protein ACLRHQ_02250 [Sellimonas intestinalis]|uniref:hypothetical protein n=1 Tax=Sellimonas intestinalis TaxID=1653434 RepID=UPI0039A0981A